MRVGIKNPKHLGFQYVNSKPYYILLTYHNGFARMQVR